MVGKPYFDGLGKSCPSLGTNQKLQHLLRSHYRLPKSSSESTLSSHKGIWYAQVRVGCHTERGDGCMLRCVC
jgi:hypothetical protein